MSEEKKSLIGSAGAVSSATLISRILGLVREQVLAAYFGAGFFTDAFLVAFRIPNLLRDLFAEGAMSASFVPNFTKHLKDFGKEDAMRLASTVINFLLVVLSAVTLFIFLFAKYLVFILASGFTPEKVELTVTLTRIMSPFLLFVALAAIFMGILNTFGRFFIPSFAPAVFNICLILAGIFLSPLMPRIGLEPIVSMAIGALAGGLGQLAIQIPSAWKVGFKHRFSASLTHPGLKKILILMIPATFGLAVTQISILVDNQIASFYGDGPVSWINYSFRIMMLPIGLFGVAIATANLAAVSKDASRKDIPALKETLSKSIRLAGLLTIPSTVGIIVLREPIIKILYERGRFGNFDTIQTSKVLLFFAIGLYAYSLIKIMVPTYYALGDTKTPVKISAFALFTKIILNLIFIITFPLMGLQGFFGLPLATSIVATLNAMLLWKGFSKRIGPLKKMGIVTVLIKTIFASLAMGILCHFLYQLLGTWFHSEQLVSQLIHLSLVVFFGILFIFSSFFLMGIRELTELFIKRKR